MALKMRLGILGLSDKPLKKDFRDPGHYAPEQRKSFCLFVGTHSLKQVTHLHYVIEFDITGFFDNVNHSKPIKQIWAMGIRGTLAGCNESYLSGPSQNTDAEGRQCQRCAVKHYFVRGDRENSLELFEVRT